jgi:hypothetical protein
MSYHKAPPLIDPSVMIAANVVWDDVSLSSSFWMSKFDRLYEEES